LLDWLRPLGFDTAEAGDGVQALERAHELRPDLVLMDLAMPGMGGLQAIESLRRHSELQQIPVIAISASISAPEANKALAAGANAFVPKPIDFGRLQQAFTDVLQITWTYAPIRG
jgi:CheY-like chemotaxis protein